MHKNKIVVFNSPRRNLQINQPLGAILDTGKVKLLIGLKRLNYAIPDFHHIWFVRTFYLTSIRQIEEVRSFEIRITPKARVRIDAS